MKLSISKKIYLLVTLILVSELSFIGLLMFTQKRLEDSFSKEIEARKVANAVNKVLADSIKAGSYAVLTFAAQDKLLAKESKLRLQKIQASHNDLIQMKGLDEEDRKTLTSMMNAVDNLCKTFHEDTAFKIIENKSELLSLHMNFEDLVSQADRLLRHMSLVQDSQTKAQEELRKQISMLVLVGVSLNVLTAFFLAAMLNRDLVSRTRLLLENFSRLAANQKLLPARPANDEIGKLDNRFNEMAQVLQKTINREQAVLQNTTDIIVSMDSLLDIQFINDACYKSLGHKPEDLVGKEIDVIVEKEDVQFVRQALLQSQDKEQPSRLELRLKQKNGSIKTHVLNSTFSQEEGLLFCILHDVTEEKRLEKRKSDFIAMVSHDMRSPLTALKLTLGLLEEGSLKQTEPDGQALIKESRAEVDRLVRLVNDLLETEKFEQGKLDIKKEEIDFEELATASIAGLKSLADEKQISIECQSPDEKIMVYCDKDRTLQVLTNIVGNAIKFSDKQSSITVSIKEIDNTVEISVQDEGPGIEAEESEQIFEQFHQVDIKKREGSGLGLFISKQLIEAQDGTIGVESESGSGSRFWVRLPVAR